MIDQASGLRTLAGEMQPYSRVASVLSEAPSCSTGTGCTTLAVCSGKGGVGKTNISISLALMLSRMNRKVVLFDADLGLANVNILLGVNPRHTLLDVVEGRLTLGEILLSGPGNLHIVPAGCGVERMANLDAIALMKLVRSLSALEAACDYLIFDTQAGISHIVKSFVSAADVPVVVATPEPSSLADAYAALKMIYQSGKTRVSVIANMVADEAQGREIYGKLAMLCEKFLEQRPEYFGALPLDRNLQSGVLRQSPVVLTNPNAPFSLAVTRMVHRLLGLTPDHETGFFRRLFDRFR